MHALATFAFWRGFLILAFTMGLLFWFVRLTMRESKDPRAIRLKWIITFLLIGGLLVPAVAMGPSVLGAIFVPIVCVAVGVVLSLLWTPHIVAVLVKPVTSAIDGGDTELEPRPLYSIAISKRKATKIQEAIEEVRGQLEKFPGDFEGEMLLASMYAEDLKDLSRASVEVQRICNRSSVMPGQLAGALNAMADWHVRFGQDVESARQCLELVIERLPGTPFEGSARQRLAHLSDVSTLVERAEPAPLVLKEGVKNIGLRTESKSLLPKELSAAEKAAQWVHRLEQFPEDHEAREQLSAVYLNDYDRPVMAIQELEHLIGRPHQPAKKMVEWLNKIADVQVRRLNDVEAAAQTLSRIIELFPNFAAAETARSRINLLRLEAKGQQKTAALTLGEYEQRLGLKKDYRREDRG